MTMTKKGWLSRVSLRTLGIAGKDTFVLALATASMNELGKGNYIIGALGFVLVFGLLVFDQVIE